MGLDSNLNPSCTESASCKFCNFNQNSAVLDLHKENTFKPASRLVDFSSVYVSKGGTAL